ncbi:IS3 family transposase [Mycetohabitans sp. B7]|nr:IS3 family transposase [Mycetohabitans sp. B3]MCG1039452.1 IS3 family transposase [Mycetohabitans sp. B7]
MLMASLVELAHERRRFDYRRLHALMKRDGIHANYKRVDRFYREAGLAVRCRCRHHGVMIERERRALPSEPRGWVNWFRGGRIVEGAASEV